MNKTKQTLLLLLAAVTGLQVLAQTPVSQMEKLSRGVVAMHKQNGGNYISWRLLGTDAANTTFDLLRDGQLVASGLTLTSYADSRGTADSKYQVVMPRRPAWPTWMATANWR